ncbi:uncharacterized protein LY89DRAFT_684830 [Mollisia scopiformis]|uniref:Uncharacterized protein n=1 Tax=Mollisia scopiformis TaxID=149040 RepID=A0A194X9I0_MOLSC|nr:uncharacterized protein LY89DRAFT_684830 [Mollisia scopiformis]KUJ16784.1 hypothetical protein LY89DRAFT_684830 [Mollisia scopiformis]
MASIKKIEDKPKTSSSHPRMAKPAKLSFTKLPAEIRYMIYPYLHLKLDRPIKISPSKGIFKRGLKEQKTGILRVDRQTYLEAGPFFYSQNTFLIGNSPNPSNEEPNLHGLKQFLTRVPKHHLAAIVNIGLVCYFDHKRSYASRAEWIFMMQTSLKRFTGATMLQCYAERWLAHPQNTLWDGGRPSENKASMKKLLTMWLDSSPEHNLSIDPVELIALRPLLRELTEDHPRVREFLQSVNSS